MKKKNKELISDYINYDLKKRRDQRAHEIIESRGGAVSSLDFYETLVVSAVFNTAQMKTVFLEDHLKRVNGWETVSPLEGRGDYTDKDGKCFELKVSTTNGNGKINMRQLRPWQNVDYYLVVYGDIDDPFASKAYRLSKDEMLNEINEVGFPTHGTKKANSKNTNIEYSITLPIKNDWDEKYLVRDFFLMPKQVELC